MTQILKIHRWKLGKCWKSSIETLFEHRTKGKETNFEQRATKTENERRTSFEFVGYLFSSLFGWVSFFSCSLMIQLTTYEVEQFTSYEKVYTDSVFKLRDRYICIHAKKQRIENTHTPWTVQFGNSSREWRYEPIGVRSRGARFLPYTFSLSPSLSLNTTRRER